MNRTDSYKFNFYASNTYFIYFDHKIQVFDLEWQPKKGKKKKEKIFLSVLIPGN